MHAHCKTLFVFIPLALAITSCGSSGARGVEPTPLPVVVDVSGITAEGRLEPLRYAHLSPAVDGIVSEILVIEGESVEAGQLLARLESAGGPSLEEVQSQATSELGLAYKALRKAQQELDDYPLPRIFLGLTAEEATRRWFAELDAANVAFAPYRDTSRKALKPRNGLPWRVYSGLPPRVLVDTGEYEGVALTHKKRVDVAWMNYTKAMQWLVLDAAVKSAQARADAARSRLERLQDPKITDLDAATRAALATSEIRAPFAGRIAKVDLKVGEIAAAGTPVITVADTSTWIIKTTDLTEIDVVNVHEGMPVTVTLDSMPGQELHGAVLSIDLDYSDRQGDVVYPVSIALADTNPNMRWGMTAQVTFQE